MYWIDLDHSWIEWVLFVATLVCLLLLKRYVRQQLRVARPETPPADEGPSLLYRNKTS